MTQKFQIQDYNPKTGTFHPVREYGVPEGYDEPIFRMFRERDEARRRRGRVLAFQRKDPRR